MDLRTGCRNEPVWTGGPAAGMSRRGPEDRLQVLVETGVDNTPRKTKQETIAMPFGACACVHVYACVLGATSGTILGELSQMLAPKKTIAMAFG